jgi:hypothetical protein
MMRLKFAVSVLLETGGGHSSAREIRLTVALQRDKSKILAISE